MRYPKRPPYFAVRFCRLLAKTCVANEIGSDAFTLLVNIAMTEDAKRYTAAVTYTNAQLMPICGFHSEEKLQRARRKAIDAGWLHYEPGRKHVPGRYWVAIPEHYAEVPDGSCDGVAVHEPDAAANMLASPPSYRAGKAGETAGESEGEASFPRGFQVETAGESEGKRREKPRENSGTFIPTPTPKPKEDPIFFRSKPGSDRPPAKPQRLPRKFDPQSLDLPAPLDVPQFHAAWSEWCAHRREIKKPLTPTSTRQQLAEFEQWGPERAVIAIRHTIGMGWQGIREPESKQNGSLAARPTLKPITPIVPGRRF